MIDFGSLNGIWALLVLIADIWAVVNIVQSRTTLGMKVLWIVVVILLPVIGFVIWFFAGPGRSKK